MHISQLGVITVVEFKQYHNNKRGTLEYPFFHVYLNIIILWDAIVNQRNTVSQWAAVN
jgi:hypothetical protein